MSLGGGPITSVAVIGAHCDDIAIGAGATLANLARSHPGIAVHALVLTGGGTLREVEEKNAFAALCGDAEVRLTVADLPDGRLPEHWGEVKKQLAEFRRSCEPDLVFAPQRHDLHQDHRLLAKLMPTEFRDHLTLGYEILKWESDLPNPTMYQTITTQQAESKVDLLHECYPSQTSHDWFDRDAFLGLMRLRGVQSRSHYAEAFVAEKVLLDLGRAGFPTSAELEY
jgi:LmbE family N-acetylglucosaminyl deacetylase